MNSILSSLVVVFATALWWGEERGEFAKSEEFRVKICHENFVRALPCGVQCKHGSCSLVKLPGTFSQLANEQWNCIWLGLKENEQIKLLSPTYRCTKMSSTHL